MNIVVNVYRAMHEWSAEVSVDEPLVRRLLGRRFPELALERVEPLAEGWDNAVWLVDGRWAFRFPRRELAVAGVRREMAVLPGLAPRLPLPVPAPAFLAEPGEGFPWPFFGAAFLPGAEICDVEASDGMRAGWARPLGRFLRALHAFDGAGLPLDPMGRADMAARVPRALAALAEGERLGLWAGLPVERLEPARDLPAAARAVLCHGDLHIRHLLIGAAGAPAAVIDWGDVCRGDPAIDLPLLFCALPPAARGDFLAEYGAVDETTLLRARVLAAFLCATLAVYAHHEGMAALRREAVASLERSFA